MTLPISLHEHAHRRQPRMRWERPSRFLESIAPAGAPEAAMAVSFTGLSDGQQARALAGFPGGQRFVLVEAPEPSRLMG